MKENKIKETPGNQCGSGSVHEKPYRELTVDEINANISKIRNANGGRGRALTEKEIDEAFGVSENAHKVSTEEAKAVSEKYNAALLNFGQHVSESFDKINKAMDEAVQNDRSMITVPNEEQRLENIKNEIRKDPSFKNRNNAARYLLSSKIKSLQDDLLKVSSTINELEKAMDNIPTENESAKINTVENVNENTTNDSNPNHYEMVNHPSHYNSSSVETIEKIRRIWGNETAALWCEITAFKYRDRIGNKPDNSNDQEVGKIKWYEAKAKELRNQI